ncbi:condensation domain-containing protein [Kitasatospora sp. NBC_01287]|uniref:condensation domain-containing protein n=1 Tax=Kitasatospora sp. NBC_01287 TaxID=2903573 RepID=UPI0022596D56|nr:condensation domain-containing protein [Kitasatospora sp. NBC_01287]MCX4750455.1 condensation domain-containing protein [Kitasatospora sp. NBC_01287]
MLATRSARLCWGQHYHLLRYHQVPAGSRHEAHITADYPLPAGCTTEHARQALTQLVRRHEGLRTVYDLRARPWPLQRVEPPAPLPVREATTEDDGTPPPAEVIRQLVRAPFDLGREWPVRACAVTTGGRLRRLHLVFNHLSFDDVALDVLCRDLDALLAARVERRPVALAPVPQQPVDLARYEAGRPAAEVDAALAHWHGELRRLPDDVFAARRDASRAPGAAHSASLTVPSLLATSRAIAARARVWPSAVQLAAYAVAVAAYTGERRVAHRMYTSQRDASGYHSVLTCMSYPTAASIDLTDDPAFSTVLRRAADRVEQAITHAHVPYDRLAELVERESRRRRRPLRIASELNFLDNAPRSCRTRRERLVWNAEPSDWATAGSDVYFRIYEWSDGITLALQAMDEVMDRETVEHFLRGYARLLDAHREPGIDLTVSQAAELIGFAAAPPGPAPDLAPKSAAESVAESVAESAPVGEAERVLLAVTAEVNGLARVDPADSYAAAGGRVLRLPRLLAELGELDWHGLTVGQLASAASLRSLAARMERCGTADG